MADGRSSIIAAYAVVAPKHGRASRTAAMPPPLLLPLAGSRGRIVTAGSWWCCCSCRVGRRLLATADPLSATAPGALYENRNPRNLERLGVLPKAYGYYHKLSLVRSNRHVYAYVKHWSQRVVVTASTYEDMHARQLYSTAGVSAARNMGRAIALRMKVLRQQQQQQQHQPQLAPSWAAG